MYRDELVSFEEEADEIQRKRTQAGKEKVSDLASEWLRNDRPPNKGTSHLWLNWLSNGDEYSCV